MARQDTNPGAILKIDKATVATLDTTSLRGEIDRRVRRVFKLMESDSATVRAAASEAIGAYADEQRELFKSKGLNPDRALDEAIVASESGGKTIYRIVPRNVPLEVKIDDDDGHVRSVVAAMKTASTMIGVARDQRRGKYNDGHQLINGEAANIDRSEYANWSAM